MTDKEGKAASAVPLWRMAAGTIGTRAIDLPSRYGFHLLVSSKLGLIDAGAFYILFSLMTLAAGAGRLGIDRAMTREIARAHARHDNGAIRRILRSGLLTVGALSLLISLLLLIAAAPIATHLFDNPRLAGPLQLCALAIPPLCLSAAIAGALAGLQRVAQSQMVYSWLWPLLFCLVALVVPLTLIQAVALLLLAMSMGAIIALFLLLRHLPPKAEAAGQAPPPLLTIGWALFTTEIILLLMSALPALFLGIFADQAAVGAFAIAWRIALILNLLVAAIGATVSPRFAHLAERDDRPGIRKIAVQAVGLALGLGLVPAIILLVAAPHILALFGSAFATGAAALRILVLAQLVGMVTAGTAEMLGMTGHEHAMRRVNDVGIIVYLPLLALGCWLWQDQGAAIATLLLALWTGIGATRLCHRYFDIVASVTLLRNLIAFRSPARSTDG